MAGSGEVQTFAELDAAANRLSHVLRNAGIEAGDHVAICMENNPQFLEVLWGCHYAGVVYTAASSRLTSDELAYIINDCGAKAFITSMYKAEQAAEVFDETPNVTLRLMIGERLMATARMKTLSQGRAISRWRTVLPGVTCCIRRVPPVGQKVCSPRCPMSRLKNGRAALRRCNSCCSEWMHQRCTCRLRRCTTPPHFDSASPRKPSGRRSY